MSVLIFLLSVLDFSSANNIPPIKYSDKIIHLFLYALWTFLMYYESHKSYFKSSRYTIYALILIPITFGGIIEILQKTLFPPRTAEWYDWLADAVGVIIGYLFAKFYFKNKYNE